MGSPFFGNNVYHKHTDIRNVFLNNPLTLCSYSIQGAQTLADGGGMGRRLRAACR